MPAPRNPELKSRPAVPRTVSEGGRSDAAKVLSEQDLRDAIDEYPELADVIGNVHQLALESLLTAVAGENAIVKGATRRQSDRLLDQLIGSDASVTVRLLAERVALMWLEVHVADLQLSKAIRKHPLASPRLMAAERRARGSHRRYLTAITALERVRNLVDRRPRPLDLSEKATEESPPAVVAFPKIGAA